MTLDPPHHVRRKRSTYEPLRIRVHYDLSVKNLPDEKFRVINVSTNLPEASTFEAKAEAVHSFRMKNTILPQALDYWRKALRVDPLQVPIRLNRYEFFVQNILLIIKYFDRKCANNKAFFHPTIQGTVDQFCVERCELITTCGEVTVPETHLEVSY